MVRKTLGAIAMAVLVTVTLAGTAAAAPGDNPFLDQLCTHPAFAADHPMGADHHVGIRTKNDYCTSDGFKHPKDYGSPKPKDKPEPKSEPDDPLP